MTVQQANTDSSRCKQQRRIADNNTAPDPPRPAKSGNEALDNLDRILQRAEHEEAERSEAWVPPAGPGPR